MVNADGSENKLKENSVVWVNSNYASGNNPGEYYVLETYVAQTGIILQRATQYVYQGYPIVYERLYVNDTWSPWAKLNS